MKAKLSMAFQDLRGKDGTVVIKKNRSGLTLTPHISPKNPQTAAQSFVRGNLSKASKTFRAFTASQAAAWEAYAESITRTNPISGETYHPAPINAFVELAAKFLQVNPAGTIPVTPPTGSFTGDNLTLDVDLDPGQLTITASGPNSAGVTTEILLQRLASIHRTPAAEAYRHKTFKAFTAGSPSVVIPVTAGVWAIAYRYVNTATGQATELQVLTTSVVSLSLASSTPKGKSKAA